jgi:hypothetical protein
MQWGSYCLQELQQFLVVGHGWWQRNCTTCTYAHTTTKTVKPDTYFITNTDTMTTCLTYMYMIGIGHSRPWLMAQLQHHISHNDGILICHFSRCSQFCLAILKLKSFLCCKNYFYELKLTKKNQFSKWLDLSFQMTTSSGQNNICPPNLIPWCLYTASWCWDCHPWGLHWCLNQHGVHSCLLNGVQISCWWVECYFHHHWLWWQDSLCLL